MEGHGLTFTLGRGNELGIYPVLINKYVCQHVVETSQKDCFVKSAILEMWQGMAQNNSVWDKIQNLTPLLPFYLF